MFKVLIADDEATIRRGLITIIDWEKFNCRIQWEAVDGVDAMEKISANPPDIVITDIRMPGMDGLELARYISENFPDIRVIILTGYADFQYARAAIKYGVIDFILKPTETQNIENALAKAVKMLEEASRMNRLKTMVMQSDKDASAHSSAAGNNILINAVNEYIERNYKKQISLSVIAKLLHVNSSYLSRLYRQETGNTLTEAVSRYRIEKAKEILLDPSIKAYEVAGMVGIEDPAYFSLLFKRYAGCSPTEYRQNNIR